jgi:hypothetical protein
MMANFLVASQAARLSAVSEQASTMELAGQMLPRLENNASAQIYMLGLQ